VAQLEAAVIDFQQPVTEVRTDDDDDDDLGDWNSWICVAAATEQQASASDEVVGTAPAQLEPGNELMIHSDHEYYRMAPTGDDVDVCSEEEVICEVQVVEVSCNEHPTDDTGNAAVLPSTCDLDLSVLADQELWDHLEQIIDTDQLLGLCNMPPAIVPSPAREKISSQQIQFSMEPSKQGHKSLPIQKNEGFDVTSPLCDMMDAYSVKPWSSQSSRNNFEASSSGIGSPFSDELGNSEDYGFHWEESFTELFPALV